jgi:hypothetical protein
MVSLGFCNQTRYCGHIYAPGVLPYLPPIDERLLAALAAEFPDRSPDLGWTDREIMWRAGQVSVVKWLAAKFQEQQEDLLTTMELGGHN